MLCLALCGTARAGSIINLELDGNFTSPTYEFYSYTSTAGQAENNIAIDPYITYLTGAGYNDTEVYSFCFDFNAPTTVGQLYPGSLETFTDPSDLEATYLMNELNALNTINAPLATRGAISTAIWQIMNASSNTGINPFPDDPAAQAYISQAVTAVDNGWWTAGDSAQYPMWVPENQDLQRYGIILLEQDSIPLPEPGSFGLIGWGIFGLAVAARFRRRSRTNRESNRFGRSFARHLPGVPEAAPPAE